MVCGGNYLQGIKSQLSNNSVVDSKGVYYQKITQNCHLGRVASCYYKELNPSVRLYIMARELVEGVCTGFRTADGKPIGL